MRKHLVKTCLLCAVFVLLTGCFAQSIDELYTPPKPPSDFQQLDAKIREVLATGAEYAPPIQGSYTQQVQLIDLDGDGVQEAIAFFRTTVTSQKPDEPDEKPMKIYIFRQTGEGNYEVQTVIQGDGNAIGSISYVDLDGRPDKELVVSWQISAKVTQLMAYSIEGGEAVDLMQASNYTDFALVDLDMDNQQEIVVLDMNTIDDTFQANFFDYDETRDMMVMKSYAPLTKGIQEIVEIDRNDSLRDSIPALFVTSELSAGVVTDILAWRDGGIVNVTLNPESDGSDSTFRFSGSIAPRDIDEDGVLELPRPNALPSLDKTMGTDNFWSVRWVQYDIAGNAWPVFTTYYNGEDGWYLILPDDWEGKIALSRSDTSNSGERAVVFYYWDGTEQTTPEEFLTVYKLTGPNRVARSQMAGRFTLRTTSDTIYAAKFNDRCSWDCGLDQDTLPEQFKLIQPDWPV